MAFTNTTSKPGMWRQVPCLLRRRAVRSATFRKATIGCSAGKSSVPTPGFLKNCNSVSKNSYTDVKKTTIRPGLLFGLPPALAPGLVATGGALPTFRLVFSTGRCPGLPKKSHRQKPADGLSGEKPKRTSLHSPAFLSPLCRPFCGDPGTATLQGRENTPTRGSRKPGSNGRLAGSRPRCGRCFGPLRQLGVGTRRQSGTPGPGHLGLPSPQKPLLRSFYAPLAQPLWQSQHSFEQCSPRNSRV